MLFRKGASGSGAPFALLLLFLCVCPLLVMHSPGLRAADCPAGHIDERVQVAYVYDGDTVKLKDGRRVRLIGINTPEMGPSGMATESFAATARTSLQDLLDRHNRTLLLQYGREHRDHYGRILAHAFLETGENIAVRLLKQGMATTLVVPPNTWGKDCYQRYENDARIDARGLWSLANYQVQEARTLPLDTRGYRIIRGQVSAVRHSRNSVWVDIEGPLVVRIARRDLDNFEPHYPGSLAGQTVEIRGWVKHDRDGLRLNVRHPAALAMITVSETL
jgi:endonuclease YncB( thermonuclease family)